MRVPCPDGVRAGRASACALDRRPYILRFPLKPSPFPALSRTCSAGMGLLCYLHLVRYVAFLEEVLHEREEAAGRERRHEQVSAQPPGHRVRFFTPDRMPPILPTALEDAGGVYRSVSI